MRTIVHVSDLHFGRVDPALLEPLHDAVHELQPDLLVVSGDLTQRARRAQFAAARDFLAGLPQPRIVVPGNHDVPLYDVARRFLAPLARFRRSIEADEFPVIPPVGERPTTRISQKVLRGALAEVTFAAATEEGDQLVGLRSRVGPDPEFGHSLDPSSVGSSRAMRRQNIAALGRAHPTND